MLYDIKKLFKELNLTDKEKENLIKEVRAEFPNDDMLFELHLYRMIQFLKKR
ncbi:MAG: hypothetical protein ACTSQP_20925 [Promethearchaeota archaeon]